MIEVLRLHHLGLAVADLQKSCRFYNTAGYELEQVMRVDEVEAASGNGLDSTQLEVAFLASPRLSLELLEFQPAGLPPLSPSDCSFGTVPVHGERAGTDPDGHLLEDGDEPELGFTLNTTDPAGTAELLAHLGFTRSGQHVRGHGTRIRLRPAESPARVEANRVGRMHVCLEVRDVHRAAATLATLGHPTVSAPRRAGELTWVFVNHPGGPGIELISID